MDLAIASSGPSQTAAPDDPLFGDLAELLRCPRCRGRLVARADKPFCTSTACEYATIGFPVTAGQPVLVDFENSVFDPAAYEKSAGSVLRRDDGTLRRAVSQFITGTNPVAGAKAAQMAALLKAQTRRPKLLVVGGGAIGAGADALYADRDLAVIGTDVYASPNTRLVADAHSLPFADESFDGVWIQAVLEHVLDPADVVAEIHRVLKPDGLVYAETPFMQQVHEEAYDFTRFTKSGHRWLFRRFAEIDAGAVGGAGTALVWSVRYCARALGASNKLATLAALPFFPLRFLDRLAGGRAGADAASGVYFLGRKAATAMTPKEVIAYYYGR